MDIWIGDNFARSEGRLLVLGESWYGALEPLTEYVPRWTRKEFNDAMFSRMFNAASGYRTERATQAQRLAWWNGIAFYNFVPGSVGESRSNRPTPAAFAAARQPLRAVLDRLQPRGVWIIGKEQAAYSADVVREFGAEYEVAPHTASYGLTSATLADSWNRLIDRVRQRGPADPQTA